MREWELAAVLLQPGVVGVHEDVGPHLEFGIGSDEVEVAGSGSAAADAAWRQTGGGKSRRQLPESIRRGGGFSPAIDLVEDVLGLPRESLDTGEFDARRSALSRLAIGPVRSKWSRSWSARCSTSGTVAQAIPAAPAAICFLAMSADLWVFAWGLSATSAAAAVFAMCSMFRSRASSEIIRAGVGMSLNASLSGSGCNLDAISG